MLLHKSQLRHTTSSLAQVCAASMHRQTRSILPVAQQWVPLTAQQHAAAVQSHSSISETGVGQNQQARCRLRQRLTI